MRTWLFLLLTVPALSGLAAFAGVLAAPMNSVNPNMGSNFINTVFAVVVICMRLIPRHRVGPLDEAGVHRLEQDEELGDVGQELRAEDPVGHLVEGPRRDVHQP